MFKAENDYAVTIKDAYLSESRFPAKQGEVNNFGEPVQVFGNITLLLEDKAGTSDIYNMELSNRTGQGNFAQEYKTDSAIKALQSIGFGVSNMADLMAQFVTVQDGSVSVPNLIGMECIAKVRQATWKDKDNQEHTVFRIKYITKQAGETRLNATALNNMRAFFAGRPASAPVSAPAPAPAAPVYQYSTAPVSAPAPSAAPGYGAGFPPQAQYYPQQAASPVNPYAKN